MASDRQCDRKTACTIGREHVREAWLGSDSYPGCPARNMPHHTAESCCVPVLVPARPSSPYLFGWTPFLSFVKIPLWHSITHVIHVYTWAHTGRVAAGCHGSGPGHFKGGCTVHHAAGPCTHHGRRGAGWHDFILFLYCCCWFVGRTELRAAVGCSRLQRRGCGRGCRVGLVMPAASVFQGSRDVSAQTPTRPTAQRRASCSKSAPAGLGQSTRQPHSCLPG